VSILNFKKYPKNTLGRDFCVGDIHGAFDSVITRMKQVHFNKETDRLFSLGDLIDRGPQSSRVVDFLEKPYVHAVRGNHDDMFAGLSLIEIRALGRMNWNGMGWVNKESNETLLKIQQALSKLPIAMEVETDRGSVGLVHADVPKGLEWGDFVMLLGIGDGEVINTALWSRERVETGDDSGVVGIDRLFVGHSIQWSGPTRLGNVYHIDSGAIFRELGDDRGFLNMANLMCQSIALAPVDQPSQIGVYAEPGTGPFGNYAKAVFLAD